MPRVSYQTTPFTIDPSARSTQTFAERYGVSPPHSNENLYGNDYTISGPGDDKYFSRSERQAKNHKADLSKASSSSNIAPQTTTTNNNNGGGCGGNNDEDENSSKASKSTVIRDAKNVPNNTRTASLDVEQRLQVSVMPVGSFFYHFLSSSGNCQLQNCSLITLCRIHHIIYVRNNFSSHSCEPKRSVVCDAEASPHNVRKIRIRKLSCSVGGKNWLVRMKHIETTRNERATSSSIYLYKDATPCRCTTWWLSHELNGKSLKPVHEVSFALFEFPSCRGILTVKWKAKKKRKSWRAMRLNANLPPNTPRRHRRS